MAEVPLMVTPALQEGVIAIAQAAAAEIMKVYAQAFAVHHKHDDSPVTAADLAAHDCILEGLRRLTPDLPVLSEESTAIPAAERRGWTRSWMVDPLDGTREFVKRNGEFTVNIALIDHGDPVYGVVQAPVTGALWHGGRGLGAFRRDSDGSERPLHGQVPARTPLRVALSRSHRNASTEEFTLRLGRIEEVGLGSSLKFCALAEGGLDLYPRFGPTSEWDTAAGQAVLEGAGGAVLDLRGRPFQYNRRDTVLNGSFIAMGDPRLPWRDWLGAAA